MGIENKPLNKQYAKLNPKPSTNQAKKDQPKIDSAKDQSAKNPSTNIEPVKNEPAKNVPNKADTASSCLIS